MRALIIAAAVAVASPVGASAQDAAPPAASQAADRGARMGPAMERFLRTRMERFIACSPYEPYRQAVDGAVLDMGRRLAIPEAQSAQRLKDSAAQAAGPVEARSAHFARCGELGGVWGLAP